MLKFLVDTHTNLCIKCKACEAVCKNFNNVPKGIFRIKVITINEGRLGQLNIPMPCMHCTDPPCLKVCPMNAISKREDGVVLVNKDKCIGCGYCAYACPFGAPQFQGSGAFGTKGKMDKCTFCVQPFNQKDENGNFIEREPLPRCAMVCPTETLLGGEIAEINREFRKRVNSYMSKGLIESMFMV
ncbi:MAG TPA: 4Fe-4S dicluster domain-containing protein [Archaeoglobaceae archaeon]|nr:4Fe-4S dicluster domain-containing protein [Archaeoglobaceae archaeon]